MLKYIVNKIRKKKDIKNRELLKQVQEELLKDLYPKKKRTKLKEKLSLVAYYNGFELSITDKDTEKNICQRFYDMIGDLEVFNVSFRQHNNIIYLDTNSESDILSTSPLGLIRYSYKRKSIETKNEISESAARKLISEEDLSIFFADAISTKSGILFKENEYTRRIDKYYEESIMKSFKTIVLYNNTVIELPSGTSSSMARKAMMVAYPEIAKFTCLDKNNFILFLTPHENRIYKKNTTTKKEKKQVVIHHTSNKSYNREDIWDTDGFNIPRIEAIDL